MAKNWIAPASWGEVCRRASGRRRSNAIRFFQAALRRQKVAALLNRYGLHTWGVQMRIARELGVAPQTISNDVAKMLETCRPCPTCGLVRPAEPVGVDDA